MQKIRKIAEVSLAAIIFGFVAAISFIAFKPLFTAANSSTRDGFQGAFMGAVFAFIFVRLGDALTRIYQRLTKNQTALVRLQHHLNDCLNLISDNIYIINLYLKIFDGYGPDVEEPRIFGNELHALPIDKELPLSLTNIEFINELYSLQVEFRKLNDSMATSNRIINQTTAAFIQKHIDHRTYAANISHYRQTMIDIKSFLNASKTDIIKILAAARVQSKEEPFLSRVIQQVLKNEYTKKQRELIAKEIEKLDAEISEIGQQSRAKIQSIQEGLY